MHLQLSGRRLHLRAFDSVSLTEIEALGGSVLTPDQFLAIMSDSDLRHSFKNFVRGAINNADTKVFWCAADVVSTEMGAVLPHSLERISDALHYFSVTAFGTAFSLSSRTKRLIPAHLKNPVIICYDADHLIDQWVPIKNRELDLPQQSKFSVAPVTLETYFGQPLEGDGVNVTTLYAFFSWSGETVYLHDWQQTAAFNPELPSIRGFRHDMAHSFWTISAASPEIAESFRVWLEWRLSISA